MRKFLLGLWLEVETKEAIHFLTINTCQSKNSNRLCKKRLVTKNLSSSMQDKLLSQGNHSLLRLKATLCSHHRIQYQFSVRVTCNPWSLGNLILLLEGLLSWLWIRDFPRIKNESDNHLETLKWQKTLLKTNFKKTKMINNRTDQLSRLNECTRTLENM